MRFARANEKLYWANVLHIYQPPTQTEWIVRKVTREAYHRLVRGLEQTPKAKITLNICGSLTEQLVKYGHEDVVKDLAELAKKGQVEFIGSAAYHPILPLLPEEEIIRQIRINEDINKKYFGSIWNPKGFFPPELAVSLGLAKILKKLGYKWVIADELAYNGKFNEVKFDKIYEVKDIFDFYIFFRKRQASDFMSRGLPRTPERLISGLKHLTKKDDFYLLTALDGETFGHHKTGLDKVLFDAYGKNQFESVNISELLSRIKKREVISPISCSWSSNRQEIRAGIPFGLWKHPKNRIHTLQWRLTEQAIQNIWQVKNESDNKWKFGRTLLDRALHSDQYWWASGRTGFGVGRLMWSLEMIEAGANELKRVIYATPNVSGKAKLAAHNLYDRIIRAAFSWQREGPIERKIRKMQDRMEKARLKILYAKTKPQAIKVLEKEMGEAAKNLEFEKAAEIRDKIVKLKGK